MTLKVVSTTNFLDPQVLAELQGLALRTRHVIEGFLSGMHRSAHIGSSTDYSQHRPYAPGDDPRQVDWKAFARTDRLFVKQYMDETNLACTLLLDGSASMRYCGTRSAWSKFEYCGCLAAALAWLLRDQGDAVGVTICNSQNQSVVPPAANDSQLHEIIRTIEASKLDSNGDMGSRIHQWASQVYERQLVIVASDLFGDQKRLHQALTNLRQFGHDVIVFQVCDRDEVDFPFDRFTEFRSLESDPEGVSMDAELIRETYLELFQKTVSELQEHCQRSSIDFLPLVTDQSLGTALGSFLTARQR